MSNNEEILSRTIKLRNLPDNYDVQELLDHFKALGPIETFKEKKNELVIIFGEKEHKEAASFYHDTPFKNFNLDIDSEVKEYEEFVEQEKQEKVEEPKQYAKLDDIPMTSSSYDCQSEFGFGSKKEKISEDLQKKKDFEIDQSNVLVSNVLYSDVFTSGSNNSYRKAEPIKEDPVNEIETSTVAPTSTATNVQTFETSRQEEPKKHQFNETTKQIIRTLEDINIPHRHKLATDDKFYGAINKGYVLVFTATWAFAWFVASL
jgi:ribosomal protein L9